MLGQQDSASRGISDSQYLREVAKGRRRMDQEAARPHELASLGDGEAGWRRTRSKGPSGRYADLKNVLDGGLQARKGATRSILPLSTTHFLPSLSAPRPLLKSARKNVGPIRSRFPDLRSP